MSNSKNVLTATDANFDSDVLGGVGLSLIDFWAEWCGPCRALGPKVEEIADEMAGQLRVYKMNVDENPNTPARFSIRGIPTIILFKGGQAVDQIVGNQPKENIVEKIQKHLG